MGARLIILVFVLVLTGCYKLSKLKQGSDYDELFMASRDNFEEVVEILDDHPLMVEIYDYMKPERVKNASQFSERDWIAFRRIRHLMPLMEVGSVTSQRNAKGISFRMSLPFMNHSRLDRINYLEGAKDVSKLFPNTLCREFEEPDWYLCSTWVCSQQMEEEKESMGMGDDTSLHVDRCENY